MALRAIVECAVQVDTFRNIDLFQQGMYLVRVEVAQEISGQTYQAQPYDLKFLTFNKETVLDSHHVSQAFIDDPSSAYYSNSFLVKYCDEEVHIGDLCLFRAEVVLGPHFHCYPLEVTVRLMHLEDSAGNSDRYRWMEISPGDFGEISKATLTVNNPCLGVHEFYPVLFDEMHFSTLDVVLHTVLLDYRFRPSGIAEEGNARPQEESSQSLDLTATLAEYLFPGSSLTLALGDEEIDKVYRAYVSLHAKGCQDLRSLVVKLRDTLPETDRLLLPDLPEGIPVSSNAPEGSSLSTEASEEEQPRIEALEGESQRRVSGRRQKFSQRTRSREPETVANLMMQEIHEISSQMCELYHALLGISQLNPRHCVGHFKSEFRIRLGDRYGESIFRDVHRVEALPLQSDEALGGLHSDIAKTRRKNPYFQALEPLPVQDVRIVGKVEALPVLFEDAYVAVDSAAEDYVRRPTQDGSTVVVLVHGFQGNSFDLRLIKNHICWLHPNYLFLCSTANENQTEGDIIDMGLRLASEVRNFIQEWCPNGGLRKISFIGHSLGGLIIRTALPFLTEYQAQMDLYMSLSSPHLGYMYSESSLIGAGLWLLKKWRKSVCLSQLSLADTEDTREATLYRMSSFEGLSWFRNVVLVSSAQDQYAPFESARIEVSTRVTKDYTNGPFYMEMASNILKQIGIERLKRIDVNFKFEGKSIDSAIGRKAHIEFLENQILMKILVYRYPEFFA